MPLVSEIDSARWYASPYFPADVLVDLFKHGKGTREWVVDNPYNELYVRYQTARTGAELRKLFVKLGPGKLHCGPRYAVDIADRRMKRSDFVAIEREFIVDVDLSDYQYDADSVEDCARAWPLVVCALQSIGLVLEEHFGFEHLVYVHSGRRGGHVWVLDAAARELTDEERSDRSVVHAARPRPAGRPPALSTGRSTTLTAALTKLAEDCFYTHCRPPGTPAASACSTTPTTAPPSCRWWRPIRGGERQRLGDRDAHAGLRRRRATLAAACHPPPGQEDRVAAAARARPS